MISYIKKHNFANVFLCVFCIYNENMASGGGPWGPTWEPWSSKVGPKAQAKDNEYPSKMAERKKYIKQNNVFVTWQYLSEDFCFYNENLASGGGLGGPTWSPGAPTWGPKAQAKDNEYPLKMEAKTKTIKSNSCFVTLQDLSRDVGIYNENLASGWGPCGPKLEP